MKASLQWLKEYVPIDVKPEELGDLLTMAGLEIEGMETIGEGFDRIIISRILEVHPHPNADRLSLCMVDTGKETIQVVCGAPNVEVGVFSPLALPGSKLPGGGVIKKGRIRGETSEGILLAEDELGLTGDHSGIMILPGALSSGAPLLSVLSVPDTVFEVSITPNRPDCTCIIGIAREIAAVTGQTLRLPEIVFKENETPIDDLTNVSILDPQGCPRYTVGMIQGVKQGISPFWMRYRLYQSGVRSINNLVDVTNYVMLEMGQPLHAFDYHRLRENRIVVRRAEAGEEFTTLDGQHRKMSPDILMICDGERPVALAGIMGGLNSEVVEETRDLLIESAFFDPLTIRRGSKFLGLSTEASYRFERGADIGGATRALKRAMSLISDLAGGNISSGIIDDFPGKTASSTIAFRTEKANAALGISLSKERMKGILKSLEMEVEDLGDKDLAIKPPSFRVDLQREVDLIEEVARLYGFDNIPVTFPSIRPSDEKEPPELQLRDSIRPVMTGLGFSEIITYSFISPDAMDRMGADKNSDLRAFTVIMNPLSADQSVLRTSLIPGILGAVRTNFNHGERNLKFFEWGKLFFQKEKDKQPIEKLCLTAVMTGAYEGKKWHNQERQVDFYDIKGAAEVLLEEMGLSNLHFAADEKHCAFDPKYSCEIAFADKMVGRLGKLSSRVIDAYDLREENIFIFELDIETLLSVQGVERKFRPFAKYPAVFRDISILLDRRIESSRIVDAIIRQGRGLTESVDIFDLYEGNKIAASEKAVALRICYRSESRTLDGDEINRLHDSVVEAVRLETGGRLREG